MLPAERREQERLVLRQTILDTARRLFAELGPDQVTMRGIAAAIGYTATTLYHHFPDKQALLNELCAGDFAALRQGFAVAGNVTDPLARLRAVGTQYAAFAAAHPHHYRLMFMTRLSESEVTAMKSACPIEQGNPTQDAYAFLLQCVHQAIAEGRLGPAWHEAQLTAQTLWAGIHGVIALHLDKGNDPWVPWCPIEQRVTATLDALMQGIEARP